METLYISGGRKDKMRAGDILGALTGEAGGFQGSDVGKIEIHERFSYVAIAKGSAGARSSNWAPAASRARGSRWGWRAELPMTHNDVLRSVRYLLNVSDATLADIIRLGHGEVSRGELVAFLKKEDEDGYQACGDAAMAHFLNGLVTYKRGKDDSRPPQPVEVPVTNNTVLKKLRVAFELKDGDIIALLQRTGLSVSKTELSAFFRRPDHRNYRECGDQLLEVCPEGPGFQTSDTVTSRHPSPGCCCRGGSSGSWARPSAGVPIPASIAWLRSRSR